MKFNSNSNYKLYNELVTPGDFNLVTEQMLFDNLLEEINDELITELNSANTFYDSPDSNVSVILKNDELYSEDIVSSIIEVYNNIGWKKVTYSHLPEDEDNYARHEFKFFFNVAKTGLSV